MTQTAEGLAARLQDRFGSEGAECRIHAGQVTMEIPSAALPGVSQALGEDPELDFRQLVDLCGVDYLDYGRSDWETSDSATESGFSRGVERGAHGDLPDPRPTRFAVVYHLLSHTRNQRVRLRCWAEGEPPRVPSVVELWPSANWFEREAFDLFGILFEGHPDLRRILTDYGFIGHPFRKDFPLSGEVEMRFDPQKRRVVYEPVSIEPRTLVPRVIRHDTRSVEEGDGADA